MRKQNIAIVSAAAISVVIALAILSWPQANTAIRSSSATSTLRATSVSITGDAIVVKGLGFTPNVQVTSTINGDKATASSTQVASDGSFSSMLKLQSNDTSGKTLRNCATDGRQ